MNAKTIEECDRLFIDIEKRIKEIKTPDKIKSHFILSALIFTIISSFLMVTAYNLSDSSFKYVFLCIAGGSVGALFSILQRNNEVVFNNQIKIEYIYFQATFTVLLGSISGGIIYLLSMSDLALTFANKNIYSLVLISIVSGFSERMIPELFGKIEKSKSKSKEEGMIWSDIVKKISAACIAGILAAASLTGQVATPPLRYR
ncbi:hypothetical protein AT00_15465 [Pseudoalteromonas lipolytica SCSIO 04301]|uniref:hypothetical protein n=1 Tax=Pseudoalteromonas lipolytica TaxID=570156 RepID=UPI00044BDADB|nr:hypothetical protein [Pseudoalteromonas lipolytica]EWH05811.1 hypothetical protein AT00_15465 [Pseudoalteromonas lipolytica SCSIO 04301]